MTLRRQNKHLLKIFDGFHLVVKEMKKKKSLCIPRLNEKIRHCRCAFRIRWTVRLKTLEPGVSFPLFCDSLNFLRLATSAELEISTEGRTAHKTLIRIKRREMLLMVFAKKLICNKYTACRPIRPVQRRRYFVAVTNSFLICVRHV